MINLRIHVLAINLRLIFNIQDIRVKKRKIGSTLPVLPYGYPRVGDEQPPLLYPYLKQGV